MRSLLVLAAVVAVASAAAVRVRDANWAVFQNANACGSLCDNPKDVPGKTHYVGMEDSQEACASTCEKDASCTAWVWSGNSHHCFWLNTTDLVAAPFKNIVTGCVAGPVGQCVPGCGSCPVPAPPPPPPFTPSKEPNMNGDYVLSATPKSGNLSLFPTQYRDYPGGVQYFDVYSPPIKSLYSQVFWTRLPSVDLPKEVVDRFDGRVMAVVGFEVNQVRRTPEGDIPVPLTVAYNHHFESDMVGKAASIERIKVEGQHDPRLPKQGHMHLIDDDGYAYVINDPHHDTEAPSAQGFGAANGGEYRKSFHGYAPGFAQLIRSPQSISITPMQIDTWNRDKMRINETKFVPGPVPRNSLAPQEGPDAIYSGLLECPLTTRITKVIQHDYHMQTSGRCTNAITADACFEAATEVLPKGTKISDRTVNEKSLPGGCTVMLSADAKATAIFNNVSSAAGAACAPAARLTGSTTSLVELTVDLDVEAQEANINITGPSDVWFGVGFNAQAMKDAPWTIIVDGHGQVTERKLADQNPGTQLKTTVTVVSSTVVSGRRTVVLKRAFKGAGPEYFTFTNSTTEIDFINAVGSGPELAYHKDKTASSLTLLPTGSPVCICALPPPPFGQAKGSLKYGDTVVGFGNTCAPQPRSDLLAQKNPTCDVRTYVGGQTACHHMWSLLDADQEIPWADQPLEYQLKFRFYYQDYVESPKPSHQNIKRTTWGIASPVEYDVPQCAPGTPTEKCVHNITGTFSVPEGTTLVAAHFHCHAPTCLSVTMYNNATGEVICREEPIYGGTGKIDRPDMDEPGYIAQPPCLWGSPEHGLQPPVDVSGQTLHIIKYSNSTYGHHGEMAWLQMFYV